MASIESVTRDAIEAWLAGLAWTVPPVDQSAHPPEPGDSPALPTVSVWFAQTTWQRKNPEARMRDGSDRAVWYHGRKRADGAITINCTEAQVESFREELPRFWFTAARETGKPSSVTIELAATFFGLADFVRLNLTGDDSMAQPEQTNITGLYQLRFGLQVDYPFIVRDTDPTGIMNVKIVLNDPDFDPDTDPPTYDLNDYEGT